MKIPDILQRARRSLTQAKARTLLTSLAISVGAFTIALALAAGNGGRDFLDKAVSGTGDTQSVQVYANDLGSSEPVDDTPLKVGEVREEAEAGLLSDADIEKIRGVEGVKQVSPILNVTLYSAAVPGGDAYQGSASVQFDGTAIELTAGSLGERSEIPKGQVVVPIKYVDALGFASAEEAIGKPIELTFTENAYDYSDVNPATFSRTFTIAAVDKVSTSPLSYYVGGFRLSNADGAEISEIQEASMTQSQYYSLMVVAEPGVSTEDVKEGILAVGEYRAETFDEFKASISQVVNIVQYGLIGFGLLAIIASVFGIINTQYISVLERTQQIGLMKALGMRSRDIGRLFRYEAAWIGFLGGLIGVVLAFLVTLFNPLINDVLELEEGTALLQLDPVSSVVLIAGLVLVAVVSGYFPSRKAAKLDPIEALRTE